MRSSVMQALAQAMDAVGRRLPEAASAIRDEDVGCQNFMRSKWLAAAFGRKVFELLGPEYRCELDPERHGVSLRMSHRVSEGFSLERADRGEFLYDLAICRERRSKGVSNQAVDVPVVDELLLIVESELDRNSRSVLADFGKLIVGKFRHRLMILAAPEPNGRQRVTNRDYAAYLASHIPTPGECFFFGFVPHPEAWHHATQWFWELLEWLGPECWEEAKMPAMSDPQLA